MTWEEAKQRRGVVTRVASALGISKAAVSQWRGFVPKARRPAVAEVLGVQETDLAPQRNEAEAA